MKIVDPLPRPIREIENTWIPLPAGGRMAARIWLPESAGPDAPVPAILEYIPYRKRDFTSVRDEPIHSYFAGHGYASIRVDMRGSGDSDGLLLDEYLAQELQDGKDAIAWIAAQPWCTGAVGMMGNSWGGFNALQVAALRPPALRAIITSCSTDDRYADDMHYMGGCLLTDTFDWGASFFAWIPRPPDPALVGDAWRTTWRERIANLTLPVEAWLRHQRRDAFWKHGSVNEDYSGIECPVFAVGGWTDGYSNAIPRLLANLSVPRLGLIGPWAHGYPHTASPGPNTNFLAEAVRWWDQWLRGVNTGIMTEPMYRAFMEERLPARTLYPASPGRWVGEAAWPSPRIADRAWQLAPDRLVDHAEPDVTLTWSSPDLTGIAGGEWCPYGTGGAGPEFPGDQREDDGRSLTFTSTPLSERVEILGAPSVELELSVDRPAAFVAVRLCDVAPDGASSRVTFGVLNLTHRRGHENLAPMVPGAAERVRVQMNDIAYAFPAGHRIRLAISTTYWPMVWPSPEPVALSLRMGSSRLLLPVRPPRSEDAALSVPDEPEMGPRAPITVLRPPRYGRMVTTDGMTGETVVTNTVVGALQAHAGTGLTFAVGGSDSCRIREGDPTSAVAESLRTVDLGRGDWQTRIVASVRLGCTREEFRLSADIEAFEGTSLFGKRSWEVAIPRDGV